MRNSILVWDILFPGTARPASAYVDSDLSEDLNSFQEYWTNRGHDVLMDELNQNHVWSLSPEERETQARQILARGLNSIYEQWAASRRVTSIATPYPNIPISPPLTSTRTSLGSSTAASSRSSIPNTNRAVLSAMNLPDLEVADHAATVASQVEHVDPQRVYSQRTPEDLPIATAEPWPMSSGEGTESFAAIAGDRTDFDQLASLEMLTSDAAMEMDFEF
jgi:hypothetical protein